MRKDILRVNRAGGAFVNATSLFADIVDVDQKEGGVIAIRKTLHTLRRDKRGATAIEYGLIAALICIAMIGGLSKLGGGAGGMWTSLSNSADLMAS